MSFLDSKFYQTLTFITNLLILNLLWILFSLPIVTIGPTTSALFAVIRDSVMHGETRVVKPFFTYFKLYFKKSFLIGLIIPILIAAITVNFLFILNLKQVVTLSLFILLSSIIISAITFLFPVIVIYNISWFEHIKNSLLYSIMYFPTTLLNLCIIALSCYCILIYPVTIFIIFSLDAYLIFLLCNRSFKITERKLVLKDQTNLET